MPVSHANSVAVRIATRQRDHGVADAFGRKDADRISADADEGSMAEGDHAAVADDEIERDRGDGEDHDPRRHVDEEFLRGERREDRHQREDEKDQKGEHKVAA